MFVRSSYTEKAKFEQIYLDIAVNYSTDAATEELLGKSTDLATDYANSGFVMVDPEVAMEEFCQVLCENLGYSATEENMAYVKSKYIKAFGVVAFDGLYMAEPVKINENGAVDWVFRCKKPFKYNGAYVNLANKECFTWDGSTLVPHPAKDADSQVFGYINAFIADEMTGAVFRNTEGRTNKAFFISSGVTEMVKSNAVDGVSVLVYVDGDNRTSVNSIESFAVGGAKIGVQERVVGYERDGQLCYVEVSKLKGEVFGGRIFDSAYEAAAAGYYYDMQMYEHPNVEP